jgi:hypothetical protein
MVSMPTPGHAKTIGHHGPREHEAGLEPEEGDDRQRGVPGGVLEIDAGPA